MSTPPKNAKMLRMQNIKKQHIITIVTVIAGLLVIWGIYSLATRGQRQTANVAGTSTTTATTETSSAAQGGSVGSTTSGTKGLTISNVQVKGKDGLAAYANSQYGFVFAYPKKDAVVIPVNIPASEQTPLLYRNDAEFAFCVKERKTSLGCAPVVTLGLADGSGHGVSVYALSEADVKAYYPKVLPNMIVDESSHVRYEIYYSDTTSIEATPAQNILRQNIMREIGESFSLIK